MAVHRADDSIFPISIEDVTARVNAAATPVPNRRVWRTDNVHVGWTPEGQAMLDVSFKAAGAQSARMKPARPARRAGVRGTEAIHGPSSANVFCSWWMTATACTSRRRGSFSGGWCRTGRDGWSMLTGNGFEMVHGVNCLSGPIASLALGLTLLCLSSAAAQLQAPVPAVDITDRAQVLALYRDYYLPPAPAAAWTGSIARRDAGTVPDDLLRATLRRVNYYRAMSGLRGNVVLDPARNLACQQAALMCALARHISHAPPPSWKGYTPAGAVAAMNSNLCVNWGPDLGPGAVDAYVADDQANNAAVGHRRWLFYPPTRVMGAGIVPTEDGVHPGANALWCRPTALDFTAFSSPSGRHEAASAAGASAVTLGALASRRAALAPGAYPTMAWPPAGYVPAPLVCARWSFSCGNADFQSARVRVTKNGRSLPVALERAAYQTSAQGRGQGVGLNTLAWTLPGNVVHFHADDFYVVRVSNVRIDGVPRDFVYPVVSIDPAVSLPDAKLRGRNDLATAYAPEGSPRWARRSAGGSRRAEDGCAWRIRWPIRIHGSLTISWQPEIWMAAAFSMLVFFGTFFP